MIPQRIGRVLLNEFGSIHSFLHRRILASPKLEKSIVNEFHKLYYDSYVWNETYWMGTPVMKCPTDLMVYQEIIFETKPDVVIETGTAYGGSALYLAHLCDALGRGRIVSIDLSHQDNLPQHLRIEYLKGSSVADTTLAALRDRIKPGDKVMVILDSDHTMQHVLAELRVYAPLVSPGNYMIVEDTNVNSHPVYPAFGAGPFEAVELFLKERTDFVIDREREKFFMTFNPSGFLKRIR